MMSGDHELTKGIEADHLHDGQTMSEKRATGYKKLRPKQLEQFN